MRYELFYWPSIQGRGEFVRLALEAAGAEYADVARLPEAEGGGVRAMLRLMDGQHAAHPPFAPPFARSRAGVPQAAASSGSASWLSSNDSLRATRLFSALSSASLCASRLARRGAAQAWLCAREEFRGEEGREER